MKGCRVGSTQETGPRSSERIGDPTGTDARGEKRISHRIRILLRSQEKHEETIIGKEENVPFSDYHGPWRHTAINSRFVFSKF